MTLILFLVVSGAILAVGYRWMGGRLARFLALDPKATTPAIAHRDGLDYEPINTSYLLPQHFSAIAAAGPIVGPILAGVYFGWVPAWLWILFGSIFIGGVHDFMTLIASVRHDARSIAEVVRRYMNRRSYLLFLAFIWISLVYVIIAFADVTAGAFVQRASVAEAAAPGPAVATSSMVYLLLAVVMGLSVRFLKVSEERAKWIFLPLVFGAILLGPLLPFDLTRFFPTSQPQLAWDYVLLIYCFFAAIAPLWLLMQPRGALGGYFLYAVMVIGVVGIVVGGLAGQVSIQAPAFGAGELFAFSGSTPPLFPILFITVACGACSGFHSIVASGTTSKQLRSETDAKPVAYGGMLLEGFFACISLATVMILAKPGGKPDATYANGVAVFMHQASFGLVSVEIARQFGLLCFATFVFDTLDACTRLARYVLLELTGWKGRAGICAATLLTLAIPALVVSLPPAVVAGKTMPIWQVFWTLFGSSNQLLAALALLGVTVWLRHLGKSVWYTLGPALFMLAMTMWSLVLIMKQYFGRVAAGASVGVHHVEFGVALLLLAMALWLVVEAGLVARAGKSAATAPAVYRGRSRGRVRRRCWRWRRAPTYFTRRAYVVAPVGGCLSWGRFVSLKIWKTPIPHHATTRLTPRRKVLGAVEPTGPVAGFVRQCRTSSVSRPHRHRCRLAVDPG
ncbi:MAG: carbon starvation protein A [Opitutae bacterium]|nr:carbon starvation protein A [Opitutae bacterium]